MDRHSPHDFTAKWAQDVLGEVVVSAKEVHDRVGELGRQITLDYAESPPLLVCVLKGAFHDRGETYGPGDFAESDEAVEHRPRVTHDGECVCFAATVRRSRPKRAPCPELLSPPSTSSRSPRRRELGHSDLRSQKLLTYRRLRRGSVVAGWISYG